MRTDKKATTYFAVWPSREERSGQGDGGGGGGGGLPPGDNLVGVVCGTFWQRFKSLAVISRAPHKAKSQRKREKKRIQ